MKPFLKWAGGKYKIIDRILMALPGGRRLIEPFAGSGAVFLNADFDDYLIADTNSDLIQLYQQVQRNGREFADYASELFKPENNTEHTFYDLRAEFNASTDPVRKSALFVYLNRHCFNGLCRYNSKGQFNVPFGRYAKTTFPHVEMLNFHTRSKRASFKVSDFREVMGQATSGSVIYCDPPYVPLSETANFSSYTKGGFALSDQRDLAEQALKAAYRGIPVVISNHDTEFTRALYVNAKISTFAVQRFISSNAGNREKAAELIAQYEPKFE